MVQQIKLHWVFSTKHFHIIVRGQEYHSGFVIIAFEVVETIITTKNHCILVLGHRFIHGDAVYLFHLGDPVPDDEDRACSKILIIWDPIIKINDVRHMPIDELIFLHLNTVLLRGGYG